MTGVVCRELGHKAGQLYHLSPANHSRTDRGVTLANLVCKGSESSLLQCSFGKKQLVTCEGVTLWLKCKDFEKGELLG